MEVRGWGAALSPCVTAIFAGAEARNRVAKAERGDALELGVCEVEWKMFGGGAEDGAVASAPS